MVFRGVSDNKEKHIYKPEIVATADGSSSLYVAELDEHYHSHHGALQEARHVFINAGLQYIADHQSEEIRIFEVGFGTGLNALLSALFAEASNRKISYTTIERYPLLADFCNGLNYPEVIGHEGAREIFDRLHTAPWEIYRPISAFFTLRKLAADMGGFTGNGETFDLVYFDAFGYRAQSDLWSDNVFETCFKMLRPGGVLTTYASKGIVRRAMQAAGFTIAKLPGPPGKREMVRATKPVL